MNQVIEFPRTRSRSYKLPPKVVEGLVYALPLSAALWVVLILAATAFL